MITCQYCRRHMTEVELSCPHCGRSRDDGTTEDVSLLGVGTPIVEMDDSPADSPSDDTKPDSDVSGGGGASDDF
jgi:hypothetical protein